MDWRRAVLNVFAIVSSERGSAMSTPLELKFPQTESGRLEETGSAAYARAW
jgi:hypothetical protein